MKLKFYLLLGLTFVLAQLQAQQTIPNFDWISGAYNIGNTSGDSVRITPSQPNNLSYIESGMFQMPGKGEGVMGVKFTLRGADGGIATYNDIGGAHTANGGAGATVGFTLWLDQSNPAFNTGSSYGLPFFVTYGKNGQSGSGASAPAAGGGGGATGMAWIQKGYSYSDYQNNTNNKTVLAVAAGGGGGEAVSATALGTGNGGGVANTSGADALLNNSQCPPYSVEVVAGSATIVDDRNYLSDQFGNALDDCGWNANSASGSTFQVSNSSDVLIGITMGQSGGQPCQWTGGPPQSSNYGTVGFNIFACGGEEIVGNGNAGGSGFCGGGAASAPMDQWVGAGGGGTAGIEGAAGYASIGTGTQTIVSAYGGENYLNNIFCTHTFTNNGGNTGNPASGSFQYETIPDTVPPVIHVKNDTLYLDENGNATLSGADIDAGSTDNDSIGHFDFSQSSFGCFDVGVHRILVTTYDFAGNSASAYDTITVLNKQTPRYPGAPGTLYLYIPPTINVGTAPYTLQQSDFPVLVDNCYASGYLTYTWPATTFTCAQAGTTQTVNFTVTTPDGRSTNTSAAFNVVNNFTAQTVYVDSSATGANTGLTWQDAFTSLQQALIAGCTGGRTIYVAQGTYFPDHGPNVTIGDRTASFIIPDGDKIYGGFPNGGDVFANRDPGKHPVDLEGAIGATPSTTYSYHVVTIPAGNANTYIEGVNIGLGYANQAGNNNGAAVYATSNNQLHQTIATLVNCTLSDNYASGNGAAVYFSDSAATGGIILQNCILSANTAHDNGGAVYINGGSTLTTQAAFTNCVFINNNAQNGGGAYFTLTQANVTNCSFGSNKAGALGGAVYVAGSISGINVQNTVMYFDTASTLNSQEIYENPAGVNISYSDVQGSGGSGSWNNAMGIDGGNNIDAGPQLLNGGSNLTVLISSPLRNKGNNSYNSTATDLSGSPRIEQDTIDIGAYEPSSVVYVDSAAAPGGDGTSWATALNNLQDGLDSALASAGIISNTRQVWVKHGTYYPTRFQGSDQGRFNTFNVQFSLKVYGGFAGSETSLSQRNVPANPTVLSGDLGVQGNNTDNAYHVVTLNEYSPTLDGFIIQDGNANHPSNYSMKYGGGLADYNYSFVIQPGNPVIRNCVFRNNLAIEGGAVSFEVTDSSYNATFIQCLFYNDTASSNGGAVYLQNGSSFSSPSNLTCNFINCTGVNNSANGFYGGFVLNLDINGAGSATSNFYNSVIWGNTVQGIASASDNVGTGASTQNYNSDLQSVAPVFVNAANPEGADGLIFTADDGLKLQPTSPVINGGNNAWLSTGNINDSLYDVTGGARVQQEVVDMGAYENFGCLGFTSLYVDDSVAVSGLGNNWSGALSSLQEALQIAYVCSEVDTIYIAQGAYYPGPPQYRVSQDTTFLIGRKITILGGYPNGGGTRDVNANPVILDGNINSSVTPDNAYHIMSIADASAGDTVTLDGLTFRNGFALGTGSYTIAGHSFSRDFGSALVVSGPAVVVRNCYFYNNRSQQGGACIEDYSGALIVSNTVFSGNLAGYGAAIRTEPGSYLAATGNTFYNNESTSDGAAINLYMSATSVSTLINNQFIQNEASGNGGAGVLDGGSSYVYNNTFYDNSAALNGGALYFMPGTSTSTVSIYNNIFYKDTALGTGIDNYNSTANTAVIQGNNSFSTTNPVFYNESNLIGPDNLWGTGDDGLELQNTSPLINQGNNSIVNYSTDITGAARIQLGAVDLGAFEADSEITRWYVSIGQDSVTGDGTSWTTAFPQFMQGVTSAKAGDSVWVAEGIYIPASGTSFSMKSSVPVYGGFNATETQLSQRNLANGYNSILQGNGTNVIVNDSVNSAAILDGFIIQNGSAATGGGMENFHSSPQVSNCVFTNNSASEFGGGMTCSSSSPTLTNVVFYNNKVNGVNVGGGAMYSTNNSTPVIRNCDFVNNTSTFNGGALYANSLGHYAISNSAFTGNTAGNLYDDNYYGPTQNVSYCLLQTGNPDSGNIISTGAGMLDPTNGAGPDGLWFTADDGLQLVYNTSNLINRGINDSVVNPGTATDIEGAPRIQNAVVDIGAYESPYYSYCDSASFNSIHVLYVDGNRPVSGDGYSWQTAFITLGEALDKANYCSTFDTVLVAAGTYYPTGYQADTNRNLSFTILRSGFEVLGGYPHGGGIRDLGANNTVLSGDIGVADTNFDNSYHVLVFQNVDNTSGIDGFIITCGAANSPNGDANGNGGGAWINGSGAAGYCKPRITNCVFTANEAYYGGAVINDAQLGGNSSPTFINCIFAKNICDLGLGGAMYNLASFSGISMPVITNCTFAENTCSGSGGGIYDDCSLSGTVSTTLKNTILWGNTSNNGLADEQFTGTGCTSTASYCLIQGGLSGSLTNGGHNLSVNPMFDDSANLTGTGGNWMTSADGLDIYAGSPAINAGNILGAPATDITGAPRIGTPDIGAYENACSGTVYDTLSITGCDSIISPAYRHWWNASGTYSDTTVTRSGCDTVFTVHLTLGHSTVDSISASACGSYTSPSGNHTWDSTGIYTDMLHNSTGCDSIIVVNLVISKASTASISPVSCGSYLSPSGHTTLTASGIYSDTIPNSVGCDSVIGINLTILPVASTSLSHAVCNGPSYNFNGRVLTASGVYYDTLSAANGCDSIITLNLSIGGLNDTAQVSGATCSASQTGASYQWLNCATGVPVSGANSRTFVATQNGDYRCAIALDNCSDTTNCVTATVNSVGDIGGYDFNLYPNPNSGRFTISCNYQGSLHIQVRGMLGDLITDQALIKPEQQFDISNLAAAVYQVTILEDKQILKVIKVVKQ